MARIGFVASSATFGGAEKYLAELALNAPAGWDSTLFGEVADWPAGLEAVELEVGPKWSVRRPSTLKSAIRDRRRLLEAVRNYPSKIDIHHCQFKREQLSLTRSLSKTAPVVWTEHGRIYRGKFDKAFHSAYSLASRDASLIICVSEEVASDVRALVAPKTAVVVVENAVDDEKFSHVSQTRKFELRREFFPPEWQNEVVAVTATRLHAAKRLERVIKNASSSGVKLLVLGEGDDRSRLEELSNADVKFLGVRGDVEKFLQAGDLYFYSASLHGEGLSLALLEASSSGLLPVGIAGDTGEDVVRELGGLVVGPGELTRHAIEVALKSGFRSQAKKRLQANSKAEWIRRHFDLFDELSSSGQRQP